MICSAPARLYIRYVSTSLPNPLRRFISNLDSTQAQARASRTGSTRHRSAVENSAPNIEPYWEDMGLEKKVGWAIASVMAEPE